MSKFVVVIFPDEAKAYEGMRAVKDLDSEGSLTLYAQAVVGKDADGRLSVKEANDQGPLGTAVGALAGGLIGLIGGPVGAAVGMASGAMIGSWRDLINLGVSQSFIDELSQKLTPGKTVLIADVDEDWVTPLDVRMEAIGGVVTREWRSDFEYEMYESELAARKAEFAQLKAEYAQARAEDRAKLAARVDQARTRLHDTANRAQVALDQRKQETEAKINALEARAAKSRSDARAKIEQRIAAQRAESSRRTAKLKQALELTKEALAP